MMMMMMMMICAHVCLNKANLNTKYAVTVVDLYLEDKDNSHKYGHLMLYRKDVLYL